MSVSQEILKAEAQLAFYYVISLGSSWWAFSGQEHLVRTVANPADATDVISVPGWPIKHDGPVAGRQTARVTLTLGFREDLVLALRASAEGEVWLRAVAPDDPVDLGQPAPPDWKVFRIDSYSVREGQVLIEALETLPQDLRLGIPLLWRHCPFRYKGPGCWDVDEATGELTAPTGFEAGDPDECNRTFEDCQRHFPYPGIRMPRFGGFFGVS